MEEDVLILLGVAFNLNLPLLTGRPSRSTGWPWNSGRTPERGCPIRLWLSAKPFLSVSTG